MENAYQLDKECRKLGKQLTSDISQRLEAIRMLQQLNDEDIQRMVDKKKEVVKAFVELSDFKPEVRPKKNAHLAIKDKKDNPRINDVGCMVVWLNKQTEDYKLPENPSEFKINGQTVMSKSMTIQDRAIFLKYYYTLVKMFYTEHSVKNFVLELSKFISEIKVEYKAVLEVIKENNLDEKNNKSLIRLRNGLSKMTNLAIISSDYWLDYIKKLD